MRDHERFATIRTGLFALTTLSIVSCAADTDQPTGTVEQAVVNPPLPSDLNLTLNAKTTVTIGALTQVFGDVGSTGLTGSVVFDVSSSQSFSDNLLANTVRVRVGATAGRIIGNDIIVDGSAASRQLGLDPSTLPPVPAVTAATPGTTNVSVAANQMKQLCPGQYGAISLAAHSTLSINGGVYQLSRLTLAEGARLEASEPVVLLVSGNLVTGTGSAIAPFSGAVKPLSAGDIRIEVGGNITIGDNAQVRAHLLVPIGTLRTGTGARLTGAGWARTINIGERGVVSAEGVFSAQAAAVPPPCNDDNACTTDVCVGGGTATGICTNTFVPSGTSCEDGNVCNGVELCDATGKCMEGTDVSQGTSCADGDACNGDETCSGTGTCRPGTPPVVNDRNACTNDSCDPATGVSNDPLPDGTTCHSRGVCEAGECSVEGTFFSEDFVQGESAPAQCNSWNDFLTNQLEDRSYSSVTMSGTFDPTGTTCTDPGAATQLCQALHRRGFARVSCDGHIWEVGSCGGMEINVDGGTCFCNFGDSVRPCTGFDEWGGINTSTCGGPSQNLTVICE